MMGPFQRQVWGYCGWNGGVSWDVDNFGRYWDSRVISRKEDQKFNVRHIKFKMLIRHSCRDSKWTGWRWGARSRLGKHMRELLVFRWNLKVWEAHQENECRQKERRLRQGLWRSGGQHLASWKPREPSAPGRRDWATVPSEASRSSRQCGPGTKAEIQANGTRERAQRCTHAPVGTSSLTKEARIYCEEKTVSSISSAGKTGQLCVKEWN